MHDAHIVNKSLGYDIQTIKYVKYISIPSMSWNAITTSSSMKHEPESAASFFLNRGITAGIINNAKQLAYFVHHYPVLTELMERINKDQETYCGSSGTQWVNICSSLNNGFTPINIKDWIMKFAVHQYSCYFHSGPKLIKVSLHIWSSTVLNDNQLLKIIETTNRAITVVTQLYSHRIDTNPKIEINYMMTFFNKQIKKHQPNENPRLDEYLRQIAVYYNKTGKYRINSSNVHKTVNIEQVNSGICFISPQKSSILIWRTEEYEKVLMHELTHYFQLEKLRLPSLIKTLNLNVSNAFPDYPNELMTECQTWYMYLVYQQSIHQSDWTATILLQKIQNEQKYALSKIVQCLIHHDLDDIEQLRGADDNKLINQNCSYIYYYILKSMIVGHLNSCSLKLILPSVNTVTVKELITHIQDAFRHLRHPINAMILDPNIDLPTTTCMVAPQT